MDVPVESMGTTGEIDPAARRRVGTTDIRVHPVALGGATFGWTLSAGETTDILDRFVALGGNLVDTADAYASGVSEQVIGSWMRSRANRDAVVVATKIGHAPELPGLSSAHIRQAVDASLERLQTDYIDLLYFHGPDPDVPLIESLSAVEELIAAGKVRALGASNFSPQLLLEARVASADGLPHIEAAAMEYSILHRDIEPEFRPLVEAQGVSLMPYFVLAHGYLGRHRAIKSADPADLRLRRAVDEANRHGSHVLARLDEVSRETGTGISALSLAWVLHQPSVTAAAVGVDDVSDLEELIDAARLTLSLAQWASLSDV
jgi:aryl-alcohol dehydrogenase-like predicted oxidoreductase